MKVVKLVCYGALAVLLPVWLYLSNKYDEDDKKEEAKDITIAFDKELVNAVRGESAASNTPNEDKVAEAIEKLQQSLPNYNTLIAALQKDRPIIVNVPQQPVSLIDSDIKGILKENGEQLKIIAAKMPYPVTVINEAKPQVNDNLPTLVIYKNSTIRPLQIKLTDADCVKDKFFIIQNNTKDSFTFHIKDDDTVKFYDQQNQQVAGVSNTTDLGKASAETTLNTSSSNSAVNSNAFKDHLVTISAMEAKAIQYGFKCNKGYRSRLLEIELINKNKNKKSIPPIQVIFGMNN